MGVIDFVAACTWHSRCDVFATSCDVL